MFLVATSARMFAPGTIVLGPWSVVDRIARPNLEVPRQALHTKTRLRRTLPSFSRCAHGRTAVRPNLLLLSFRCSILLWGRCLKSPRKTSGAFLCTRRSSVPNIEVGCATCAWPWEIRATADLFLGLKPQQGIPIRSFMNMRVGPSLGYARNLNASPNLYTGLPQSVAPRFWPRGRIAELRSAAAGVHDRMEPHPTVICFSAGSRFPISAQFATFHQAPM